MRENATRRQKADDRTRDVQHDTTPDLVAFPDERSDGTLELVLAGEYSRGGAWVSATSVVNLEDWR